MSTGNSTAYTPSWYIVQDNTDHWLTDVPDFDNRRKLAENTLNTLGQHEGATLQGVYETLSTTTNGETRGVLNEETIFTTVIDARKNHFSTAIRTWKS